MAVDPAWIRGVSCEARLELRTSHAMEREMPKDPSKQKPKAPKAPKADKKADK